MSLSEPVDVPIGPPVLDAYANTAVRRARPSSRIETDDPAPEPPPSPIAMRNLEENG